MLKPRGVPSLLLNLIYFKTILFLPKFPILFEMTMYYSIVYAPDIAFNFPTTHTHILYTMGNTEVPTCPTSRDQMLLFGRNFYLYRMGVCNALLKFKLWGCACALFNVKYYVWGQGPPAPFSMLNLTYFKTILFLLKFPILFEMMMYDSIVCAPDITFNFLTTHTPTLYTVGNNEVPASPTARDQMVLLVRTFYLYRAGVCVLLNVKCYG